MTVRAATPDELDDLLDDEAAYRKVVHSATRHITDLARRDPNVFLEYVLRDEETGEPIRQRPMHVELQQLALDTKYLVVWSYPESGKCAASGERVLLANGRHVPIETLTERTRILILDPDRRQLRTVEAGPVTDNGERVLRVLHLASGRSLRVTREHPVYVRDTGWVRADAVVPGMDLLSVGSLPLEVPPDPTLRVEDGVLLAVMGSRTPPPASLHGGTVPAGIMASRAFLGALEALERGCAYHGWTVRRRGGGLAIEARPGAQESPAAYAARTGARTTRSGRRVPDVLWGAPLDLVRAYVATVFLEATRPGGVGRYATITSPSRAFLADMQLLLLRLGILASVGSVSLSSPQTGQRVAGAPVPSLSLLDEDDLGRVRDLGHDLSPRPLFAWDPVVRVRPTPAETTWALEVHDPAHCYVQNGLASHNTNQLSIGHALWRLGNNPNLRVVVCSNTGRQAVKIVRSVKNLIERSAELRAVFPHLVQGHVWTDTHFTVQGANLGRKDYSFEALGMHGNITGARIDLLILDDILDFENTRTDSVRKDGLHWLQKTLFNRLTKHGKVLCGGNTWHPEDAMHQIAQRAGWVSRKFPLLDAEGVCADPARYPPERIEDVKVQSGGPLEFSRLYLCNPRDDSEARFPMSALGRALELGAGKTLRVRLDPPEIPRGADVVTGVDLGVAMGRSAGRTVMTTVLFHEGKKFLVGKESGKWSADEIIERAVRVQARFNSRLFVESNAAQDFLVQMIRSRGLSTQVHAFVTGRNKHDPKFGVEAISAEMSAGVWTIPSPTGNMAGAEPEVQLLLEDMLYYTPEQHTGDALMSLWIASEGARIKKPKIRFRSVDMFSR